jgi:hypothetical protein
MRFINRLGVEIEGAWHKTFDDVEIHSDESVYCPANVDSQTGHWGEVGTSYGGVTYTEAVAFIKSHLPDGVFSGERNGKWYTCGMHVHASMKTLGAYAALSSEEFFHYFYQKCEEWGKEKGLPPEHEFWTRVRGKNRYCKKIFRPHTQLGLIMKHNNEDRRTGINYCFALHGTVEFRLFPQFVKGEEDLAVGCLDLVVNSIEEFLATRKGKRLTWKNTSYAVELAAASGVRKELEL